MCSVILGRSYSHNSILLISTHITTLTGKIDEKYQPQIPKMDVVVSNATQIFLTKSKYR